MPFCTSCGQEYGADARFCPACGARVVVPEISSTPVSAPAISAAATATAASPLAPAQSARTKSVAPAAHADLPPAGRTKRIVAGLIDLGIAAGFMLLLLTAPGGLRAFMKSGFIFRILSFAPGLYLLLRDSLGGHSIGKLIVGLVVVDTRTRRRAGILESVVRNWPLALIGIPTLGWFVAGLAAAWMSCEVLIGKKQRFMDGSATTQVIEERFLTGA